MHTIKKYMCYFAASTVTSAVSIFIFLMLLMGDLLEAWQELGMVLVKDRFWMLIGLFFMLIILIESVFSRRQILPCQGKRPIMFKRLGFLTIVPFTLIPFVWLSMSQEWSPQVMASYDAVVVDKQSRIKGVHYFRSRRDTNLDLQPLIQSNVEQVVLVPYVYQTSHHSADLRFRRGRRSSRDSSYLVIAEQASQQGLEIIVKPHIWMETDQGTWRSDIDFLTEDDGNTWGENYTAFILHYAELSEQMCAPYFCIGTELTEVTRKYPYYWSELIQKVRSVYSGKVFYAANWYQEYEQISFWDELDFIGIQAYFPLGKTHHPSAEQLCDYWRPHMRKLKKFGEKWNRPILFSELGYKSTGDAAISPWEWMDSAAKLTKAISTETQANCYEAFFRTFWNEPWFAGALIWQWRGNHLNAGGSDNLDFTPQNKPAQKVMTKWFGKP
jgi:hypothetical protein